MSERFDFPLPNNCDEPFYEPMPSNIKHPKSPYTQKANEVAKLNARIDVTEDETELDILFAQRRAILFEIIARQFIVPASDRTAE